MLRIGIAGCGAIFPTQAKASQELRGATLAAVFDVDAGRARSASERFEVPAARSWREFLRMVDAVSICVPSGYHAQVGISAAKAGKHVLCEKPIDVSLRRATHLVDACRNARVKLSVISQHRFANDIRRARHMAQGGELGDLLQGNGSVMWYRTQAYYDQDAWRGTRKLDGGCLMNQGIHTLDMIQWIMGGVRAVQARMRTVGHRMEAEDQATALIEYRNGAMGVIQATTCAYPGFSERLEVFGRHGSITIEGDRIKLMEVDPDADDGSPYGRGVTAQPTPNVSCSREDALAEDPTALWGEQHRLQMQDWVAAILDDREPFINGEAALEPVRVIQAIYRSGRMGGKRVEVAS